MKDTESASQWLEVEGKHGVHREGQGREVGRRKTRKQQGNTNRNKEKAVLTVQKKERKSVD